MLPIPLVLAWFASLLHQDSAALSASWTPLEHYQVHVEAHHQYDQRAWAEAVPLLEQLVQAYDQDSELWVRLGFGRYYLQDTPGSIAAFERAHAQGTSDMPRLASNLARLHVQAGDLDAALSWVGVALDSGASSRGDLSGDPSLSALHGAPSWSSVAGESLPEDPARDEGWRFDLRYLVSEAQRLNPGPTRPAFSQAFLAQAQQLEVSIPERTNDEIVTEMMRLIALLGDGHSAIYGPGDESPLEFDRRVLPFKLYRFPSGLFVVDGAGEWSQYAGQRVDRIGGVGAGELFDRMSALRGGDNSMTWTWMGPQFYLRRVSLLRSMGVEVEGTHVEVVLSSSEGGQQTVHVECGDYPLVRKLRPTPAASGEVPLYLRAVDRNFWMETFPDHDAVYFQFNKVRDGQAESIADFAGRLREALAESEAQHLIVDVRHNNGGNNSLVRPLVRAMVEFELQSPENRIYVITGRNTFSAAQNFINRVERWTDAVFIGEPSSSSPNFTGEENEIQLPFSRVHGSLSNLYWQDSNPGDERPWIAPHVPVILTAPDYFANVDPILNAVLALISGS